MIVAIMTTALSGTAAAATKTITAGALTNGVLTDSPFTLTFAKNSGSTEPTYNSNGGDVRLYAKGTVAVASTGGNMTQIVFNISTQGKKRLAPITASVGTIATQSSSDETVTWTGDAASVTFTVGDKADYGSDGSGKAGQLCFSSVDITYTAGGTPTPSISANDVNILYSATNGSIAYTLSNATGNVTASLTDGDWLTLGTITSSTVPFTCSPNTGSTARTATVTLSYTGATDKVVTVTQAVNPNLSNIAALTSQTAGEYSVSLTDALVTYINGNYAYLEDASGAVMLFKCSDGLAVGDKITGTANVTYTVYNGLPEVTAFELATGYTKTSGNTVTPTTVTIADLIGNNASNYLSRYVKIEGATVTSAFSNKNSTIEQSGSSIVLRDQNSSATLSTTANTTVTVTAHPSIYNSTHQIAVYEQSQIVVAKVDPTITFNNGTVHVGQSIDLTSLFTSNSDGAVTYSITAGGSNATLSNSTLTGTAEGTVTVKAEQAATDAFNASEATATITVTPALVLSSIAVTTAPTTTTYDEGDYFDPTGMVVTATYTDNSTEAVTDYTYTPDGALTTSDTEITISYTENDVTKTTTQAITVNEVHDYATLPFEWAGGVLSGFSALTGTSYSLNDTGSYAESHGTYRIKFTKTDDYLQVKTDGQPGTVTVGVKMIGGTNASSIIVQESSDGSTFTNVETLSISGSSNATLSLETSNAFASTSRYVRLTFNKGSNVGVGAITIAKASTDPVINADASVELTAEKTSGEIAYTISNPVGGTSLTAAENPDVDWISDVTVANDKVTFTTTVNNGSERTATITLTYGSVTKDVTVTQAEHIDINTYTLASAITSGKHYVIAATTSTKTVAMGGKNASKAYYDAVDASLSGETLSVASNSGVEEFVIYGPDPEGFYTIYDPVAGGYLYASSGTSNDLSNQTDNDANGRWEIDFENETVTAQGTNSHNLLRYNSGSPRFSCYTSGQTAVQFYEKSGEATPTESVTVGNLSYATFASDNALDFTSSSIKAFYATESAGTLSFTQVTKVPAGTGVLLYADGGATESVPALTGEADAVTGNVFVRGEGAAVTYAEEDQNYILFNGADGIGFYKANNNNVATNRAYIHVENGSGVKGFVINLEDDATGINEELRIKNEESSIYNLAGQRLDNSQFTIHNSQLKRGIYIVNGKKILK